MLHVVVVFDMLQVVVAGRVVGAVQRGVHSRRSCRATQVGLWDLGLRFARVMITDAQLLECTTWAKGLWNACAPLESSGASALIALQ